MSDILPYPGENADGLQQVEFSRWVKASRTETGKARTDFAIWLGGSLLGEAFYRLSDDERREVEEGVAGIFMTGFRSGAEFILQQQVTAQEQENS